VGIGKAVTLFLSWLNEYLAAYSLGVVVVVFIGIGFTMLAVAVPGVPVYLAGGVIVTNAAFNTAKWNFWAACVLATVVCLLVKVIAIVVQQKGFGEGLGKSVGVRKTVGVNSITIRAIGGSDCTRCTQRARERAVVSGGLGADPALSVCVCGALLSSVRCRRRCRCVLLHRHAAG
jgi:hypothetical protein